MWSPSELEVDAHSKLKKKNSKINHKSVMTNIQDPEARGTMIFAWWMACLAVRSIRILVYIR